jgi:hypothetical protein
MAMVFAIYTMQLLSLADIRIGHQVVDWNGLLVSCIESNSWPYSVIPTMLYCWQYYDIMEFVAVPAYK